MNKARHKKIQRLIEKLAKLKGEVEAIGEAEQSQFDNASERVQESEKGEQMEEAARDIELAVDDIQGAIDYLTMAQGEE